MKIERRMARMKVYGEAEQPFSYVNTPLGVYFSDGDEFFANGCNISDKGEFIPAPGFAELESPSPDTVIIGRESARVSLAELRAVAEELRDADQPGGNELYSAIEELERVTKDQP